MGTTHPMHACRHPHRLHAVPSRVTRLKENGQRPSGPISKSGTRCRTTRQAAAWSSVVGQFAGSLRSTGVAKSSGLYGLRKYVVTFLSRLWTKQTLTTPSVLAPVPQLMGVHGALENMLVSDSEADPSRSGGAAWKIVGRASSPRADKNCPTSCSLKR
mmetsp:Transcript_59314/g.108176  ORF Transcript_59314/g.108176 Transcript_59314/m.108176 type:complete len:158 (+) Transcript_59314:986-1459(+)